MNSDTTAASLACIFYHLAAQPELVEYLRKEIDQYFEEHEIVDAMSLSKLKSLDGVINEGLRLHPPVPSGIQRVTPPNGLFVGETFIPGNTIVQIPFHTTFRGMYISFRSETIKLLIYYIIDERNYIRPTEFLPQRWTERPELVADTSSFAPFLIGKLDFISD